ncbi:MAG: cupin domain-containing protein [Solirubrobacteraceae bacterium]|nr:cupin domain-containing protein [Solirubrobacteraceae bacterium]
MSLAPVRAADTRRTDTPNAAMTTLASPTLGGTDNLSLWRVAMTAGQQGPPHIFDTEQIWTVLEGAVAVETRQGTVELHAGDTLAVPAGIERQVTAVQDTVALVAGDGTASVFVPGEDAPRGTPPWIV